MSSHTRCSVNSSLLPEPATTKKARGRPPKAGGAVQATVEEKANGEGAAAKQATTTDKAGAQLASAAAQEKQARADGRAAKKEAAEAAKEEK